MKATKRTLSFAEIKAIFGGTATDKIEGSIIEIIEDTEPREFRGHLTTENYKECGLESAGDVRIIDTETNEHIKFNMRNIPAGDFYIKGVDTENGVIYGEILNEDRAKIPTLSFKDYRKFKVFIDRFNKYQPNTEYKMHEIKDMYESGDVEIHGNSYQTLAKNKEEAEKIIFGHLCATVGEDKAKEFISTAPVRKAK